MKFMVCSCDEALFNDIVGFCPILGTHERFVLTADDFEFLSDDFGDDLVIEMDEF